MIIANSSIAASYSHILHLIIGPELTPKLGPMTVHLWINDGLMAIFFLLNLAMRTISLGTAYAVWTGIGAAGTAVVGVWFFGETMNTQQIFFLCLLIASIIGLKLVS